MFDDFAVLIEAKNVNPRPIVIARPLLKTMQHYIVALSNDALEVNAFSGVLFAIRVKYSTNASLPSATAGLC